MCPVGTRPRGSSLGGGSGSMAVTKSEVTLMSTLFCFALTSSAQSDMGVTLLTHTFHFGHRGKLITEYLLLYTPRTDIQLLICLCHLAWSVWAFIKDFIIHLYDSALFRLLIIGPPAIDEWMNEKNRRLDSSL